VVLEHCGHLSTLEQPAAATQALGDWLQAHPARPRLRYGVRVTGAIVRPRPLSAETETSYRRRAHMVMSWRRAFAARGFVLAD
jgi:hypothetical protein